MSDGDKPWLTNREAAWLLAVAAVVWVVKLPGRLVRRLLHK